MFKKQEGITLVALVITIIVLLILAGVSISLVVGRNGVLTQASDAVKTTNIASAKQDVEMAVAGVFTQYMAGKAEDQSKTLSEYLTVTNLQANATDTSATWTVDSTSGVGSYTQGAAKGGAKVNFTVNMTTGEVTFGTVE